jgi:hypothetical protein
MQYTRIRLTVKEINGETGIRIIDHKHKSSVLNDKRYFQIYYNSIVDEYRKQGVEVIKHSMKDITENEYTTNNPWGWYAP